MQLELPSAMKQLRSTVLFIVLPSSKADYFERKFWNSVFSRHLRTLLLSPFSRCRGEYFQIVAMLLLAENHLSCKAGMLQIRKNDVSTYIDLKHYIRFVRV